MAPDAKGFQFTVDNKGFAWTWMERVDPKGARVANPDVIAVRVANQLEKDSLLALDSGVFFTEPHWGAWFDRGRRSPFAPVRS